MTTQDILLLGAVTIAAAAVLSAAIAEGWHRRRSRWETDRLAALTPLAARAAVAQAQAADREWHAAHSAYDARAYIVAGLLRTLARASRSRADALLAAHLTGVAPSGPVIADAWQVPVELRAGEDRRAIAGEWAGFDRAVNALAAIGTSTRSTLGQVADAHLQLADAALELAERLEVVASETAGDPTGAGAGALYCSFCGLSSRDVRRLIAGPGVHICDQCVWLCNEILGEEPGQPT
jgi:hypothetical protein